ncbi:MAG TPA: AbrB/MazE/SpoVT family DNA-binding domain-containing protein [Wenzhouxiangella sp.]|nr:AbrB/MazE/SpoVT family DNA-binding domain-containing protein [Wenzhouxiangella sp.]
METVRISSKYQVVIPKAVRRELNLEPGQVVIVMAKGRALEIVPVGDISSARGSLRGADPADYRDRKDRV